MTAPSFVSVFISVLVAFSAGLLGAGCATDEAADAGRASSSTAPAAYVPPPENVSPPPANTRWIGPNGYQR